MNTVNINNCFALVKIKTKNDSYLYHQCKNVSKVSDEKNKVCLYCNLHDSQKNRTCGSIISIYSTFEDNQWIGMVEEIYFKVKNENNYSQKYYLLIVQLYYIIKHTQNVWKRNTDFTFFVVTLIHYFIDYNQSNKLWEQLDLSIFSFREISTTSNQLQECVNCYELMPKKYFTNTPCCCKSLCKNCWINNENIATQYEVEDYDENDNLFTQTLEKELQCMYCRAPLPKYIDYLLDLLSLK